jgi:hypothetical protein
MKTFNTSLSQGNLGETYFEKYLNTNPSVLGWKKMDYITDFNRTSTGVEYDYLVRQADGNDYSFEIKTLAGASSTSRYNTFAIEVFASDDKTRRPGWFRSSEANALDFVVVISKFDKKMYFFDARKLMAYVDSLPDKAYTRCGDGNKNDKGWIVKCAWTDTNAGFQFARDLV